MRIIEPLIRKSLRYQNHGFDNNTAAFMKIIPPRNDIVNMIAEHHNTTAAHRRTRFGFMISENRSEMSAPADTRNIIW